jgi:hypothetical protein
MKTIILATVLLVAVAGGVSAGPMNCHWNGIEMQCQPGWMWNHHERREMRDEDRWRDEEHQRHEQMERRREWCRWHPGAC